MEIIQVMYKFRSKNGSYDCIAPGSGGKDSYYAALVLKNEFGMNPLTVTGHHIFIPIGVEHFKN